MFCHGCGCLSDDILCTGCRKKLSMLSHVGSGCENDVFWYGPYRDELARLLWRYKVIGDRALVPFLSSIYRGMLERFPETTVLVPVPSSRNGLAERGFDQMIVVCRYLERHFGYRVLQMFGRAGTGNQKSRSRNQRKAATSFFLRDDCIFRLQEAAGDGCRFVLLDDIVTTGATIQACRNLSKRVLDSRLFAIVVAHG